MRLEGIATIAEANAFLPAYMARHNQRFAKAPVDPRDLHRPLAPHDDLKAEMVWREQRTVTSALTLHYNKALFILEPNEISRLLAGKRVAVCEYPDGGLEIRHEEHALPYRVFDISGVSRPEALIMPLFSLVAITTAESITPSSVFSFFATCISATES